MPFPFSLQEGGVYENINIFMAGGRHPRVGPGGHTQTEGGVIRWNPPIVDIVKFLFGISAEEKVVVPKIVVFSIQTKIKNNTQVDQNDTQKKVIKNDQR